MLSRIFGILFLVILSHISIALGDGNIQESPSSTEQSPLPRVGEIVITAPRGVPLEFPGGRSVIEKEELERYPGGSLNEVFRRVPGLYVPLETGTDSKPNVGVRGLNSRRSAYTTFLIDGIPATPAPYGDTDVTVFPITMERVERVDVIRGGGATRFGPNTVGGIINLKTADIPAKSNAWTRLRIGSDRDVSSFVAGGGTWGPVGFLVSGVRKSGNNFRDNGDYAIEDYSAKLRYDVDDKRYLLATVSRYDEESELPGGLTQSAYDENSGQSIRKGDDFVGDRWGGSLQYVARPDPNSAIELSLYGHNLFRSFDLLQPAAPPFTKVRTTAMSYDVVGTEIRYFRKTNMFGLKHEFAHGARVIKEDVMADFFSVPVGGGAETVIQETSYETLAVSFFTDDTIMLTDAVQLMVGGRIETIGMASRSDLTGDRFTEDFNVFLPTTGISWRIAPAAALFADYQESFRAPQYWTMDVSSEYFQDLDPERSRNYEAGVRITDFGGLRGSANLFWTEFNDQVVSSIAPSGAAVWTNLDRTLHKGAEVETAYDFSKAAPFFNGLSAYATCTILKATIERGATEGNDVPNAPRWRWSWGLDYDLPYGFWAQLDGVAVGKAYSHKENYTDGSGDGRQGRQPDFVVWNLAAGYNSRKDGSGLQIKAGVTNLFDEEYFTRHLFGIYPAPERRYFTTIGYTLNF